MWFAELEAALDEVSTAESRDDDDSFSSSSDDSAMESQDDDSFSSNSDDSATESQDGDSLSLSEELHNGSADGWSYYLSTSKLNGVENVNNRMEAIVQLIESSDVKGLLLDEAPADEEFGHVVSQAVLLNPHFTSLVFWPDDHVAVRDLIPWVSSHGTTLMHLGSLVKVDISGAEHFAMQDWNFLFALLRTSMSLQELEIYFFGRNSGREANAVMSAIACFLGGSSLTKFKYMNTYLRPVSLLGAAFASLCEGIAKSSLRELTFVSYHVVHVETAAEFLARAIVQSSLELVDVTPQMRSALTRTKSVRDLNFCFSQNSEGNLIINRKWKPLLSANVPLGVWPHILQRAHASPETTSHGTAGILFFLLKEKCDLVPRSSTP